MPKFVMSDARVFTDYNPSCEINKAIQTKYKLSNSHDYRAFLQANADQLMLDAAKSSQGEDCKFCPVCKEALNYKP